MTVIKSTVLFFIALCKFLTLSQRVCPRGWLYVNDQCWRYETTPETWPSAKQSCEQMGASLASIHTEEENRFLYSLIQKYGISFPDKKGFEMVFSRSQFDIQNDQKRLAVQTLDLTCFEKISNAALVGFAEAALNTRTADDCLVECLESLDTYSFKCRSVMYYSDTEECILNSEDRTSQPGLFTRETFGENVDYYDNNCDGSTTPEPEETENCFTKFANSILVGYVEEVVEDISVEECRKECLNAESTFNLDCNSFMYYRADRVCILNSHTKDTDPELFTSDTEADYYHKLDPCPDDCKQLVDIVFVVDGSGSIGPIDFENIRKFLSSLVDELSVGPEDSQVGVVQFTQTPVTEFHLRSFQTKSEVKAAIQRIGWRNGRTMIGRGLQHVIDKELVLNQGDRPSVQNVVIVLTDGLSQDNPGPPATTLRNRGTITYAIGVTDAVFDEQLLTIAGTEDRVYKVRDFTRLDSRLKDALLAQICRSTTPMPNGDGGTRIPLDGVWLGLTDERGNDEFQWVDKSRLDYENWKFGQPDNKRGEQCVMSEFEPLQRWSDTRCNQMKPFVCKQSPRGRLNDVNVLFRNPALRHERRVARYKALFRKLRI